MHCAWPKPGREGARRGHGAAGRRRGIARGDCRRRSCPASVVVCRGGGRCAARGPATLRGRAGAGLAGDGTNASGRDSYGGRAEPDRVRRSIRRSRHGRVARSTRARIQCCAGARTRATRGRAGSPRRRAQTRSRRARAACTFGSRRSVPSRRRVSPCVGRGCALRSMRRCNHSLVDCETAAETAAVMIGAPRARRPRARVLPPPAGGTRERLLALTGVLVDRERPTVVGPLDADAAADQLLAYLERHGYFTDQKQDEP